MSDLLIINNAPPIVITIEERPLVLTQVPGVGPPGSIEGGFTVDGAPPFNFTATIPVVIEGTGETPIQAPPRDGQIGVIQASSNRVPTDQALMFHLLKNGGLVAAVTIPIGAKLGETDGLAELFVDGDQFRIDCTQRDSSGSPLSASVTVWYF